MLFGILALILGIVLVLLLLQYYKIQKELIELKVNFDRKVSENANQLATRLYEEWIRTRLSEEKSTLESNIRKEYKVKFQEWVIKKEKEIREDAIKRSISVLLGKIGEHIAPLLIAREYDINPKDLRFLGTPVDYIAFKGLSDGNPQEIIFIEVKSSRSGALSKRERDVKRLVEARKVSWRTFNLRDVVERAKVLSEEEVVKVAREQVG